MEIYRKDDREFWIGESRTILTDQNIIHVNVVGEQTDEIALLQKQLNLKLFEMVKGEVAFLIDLNRSGKNSPGARATWHQMAAHEKVRKAAIFGLNPVVRVIASFVIGFSVKKNERFFKTEQEARSWLDE